MNHWSVTWLEKNAEKKISKKEKNNFLKNHDWIKHWLDRSFWCKNLCRKSFLDSFGDSIDDHSFILSLSKKISCKPIWLLKVAPSPSKKNLFNLLQWHYFKNDGKCFLFHGKNSFCSWNKFLSWLFGLVEKRLDKKAMVNFKIYDITNWTTNNCNTYLPNVSKSKSNQTMKFGQLMEYDMINIFLEDSYSKCDEEGSSRPFDKKSKSSIYLGQQSEL